MPRRLVSGVSVTAFATSSFAHSNTQDSHPYTHASDEVVGGVQIRSSQRPIAPVRAFVASAAALWAKVMRETRERKGGTLYAVTFRPHTNIHDPQKRDQRCLDFVAALADYGDDVVGALEDRDKRRRQRQRHIHLIVRSHASLGEMKKRLLAAGSHHGQVKRIDDLARWARYCAKNIRVTDVRALVVSAGSVRLSSGRRIRARTLEHPVIPKTRVRRLTPPHVECVVCHRAHDGRNRRKTCSNACRQKKWRERESS